jgi:hypothetical protein
MRKIVLVGKRQTKKRKSGNRNKRGVRAELQAKDTWYPRLMKDLEKMNRRAETGKIVVRARETPWMQNRNAKVRYYFMPYKTDTALQTMQAFARHLPPFRQAPTSGRSGDFRSRRGGLHVSRRQPL